MIQKHTQSGFSLVETLVAITILMIVIVGPLTIVTTTSKSTNFSNAQVVGFYLAQEGAELAQKARDDIVLNRFLDSADPEYGTRFDDTPWADFIDESGGAEFEDCFSSYGCSIEVGVDSEGTISIPDSCGVQMSGCELWFDTADVRSRYTHTDLGAANLTPYRRAVTFENVDPGGTDEIKVVSRVEWSTGISRDFESVEVVTYLFDVYGN